MIKSIKWNYLAISFVFISVSAFAAKLNVETVLKNNVLPRNLIVTAKPVLVDMHSKMARFKVIDIRGAEAKECYINASLTPSRVDEHVFSAELDSISCFREGHKIVRRAYGQVHGMSASFNGLKINCKHQICRPLSKVVSVVLSDDIDLSPVN